MPEGTSSHSQEYLDAGKSQKAHEAVFCGAAILAAASMELAENGAVLDRVKEDFRKRRNG